jgi:ubiquitin-protein ligase
MEVFNDHLLLLEYNACVEQLPKDIIIQPSLRTFKQWQVFISPTNGPYSGKTLAFNIHFVKYPQQVPTVIFQSNVVHPLIDASSSQYKTTALIKEWTKDSRVHDLILMIFNSFLEIPTNKEPVNPDADLLLKGQTTLSQILMQIGVPDPAENREHNTPKKWTQQKELLCKALYPNPAK